MAGRVGDRQPELQRRQPRQARHRARPEDARPAQDAFRRLARRADILIENYRPGVMRALRPRLRDAAPRQPRADLRVDLRLRPDRARSRAKGGFDLVAQGVSGIMSITGEPGGPPVKVGVPLTDLGAGAVRAVGHPRGAALPRRAPGRGQHIDTSLVEAGVALSVWEAAEYFSGGGIPQPMGSAHRMSAPYQAIRCADGYITLAAANDRLFGRLCELLGHPEWARDPEFADDTAPGPEPRGAGRARSRPSPLQQPRAHWLALFEANGIPCGPINDYAQVFADPQVARAGHGVETDHPTLGRIRTLGSPIKMSATPPLVGRRAPLLGEHTEKCCARPVQRRRDRASYRLAFLSVRL